MPYKVTLKREEQTETVIVKAIRMLSDNIQILEDFDPHLCPDGMRDGIMFNSKGLSGMILEDSEVKVTKVEYTDEPAQQPEPTF